MTEAEIAKSEKKGAERSGKRHNKPNRWRTKKFAFDPQQLKEIDGQSIFDELVDARVELVAEDKVFLSLIDADWSGYAKAYVPREEFRHNPQESEQIKIYVEKPTLVGAEQETVLKASLEKAEELSCVTAVLSALQTKERVQGMMVAQVKGGFSVQLLAKTREEAEEGVGVRAFLPGRNAQIHRGHNFEPSATQAYEFEVEEYDAATGSIIVSRRQLLEEQKKELQDATWVKLKLDDVVDGIVRSITDYGAFVEVDGVDGLLHRSDIAWDSKASPASVLKVGQTVRAKVIELDKDKGRLKLGLKQLIPDPWRTVESHYAVGNDVEGTVVALADFGAFVRLEEGVEGLIHLSEISWKRIKHPSQRFHIGDKVVARVLGMEKDQHRISLSAKAAEKSPVEKVMEKFPVGTKFKTTVVGIEDFGVFVKLDDIVAGLVHVGELTWTQKIAHPSEVYKVGDEVEVVILSFDTDRQRVSCSIRQVTEDPWRVWRDKYARGTVHKVKVAKVAAQGAELELEPDLLAFCPTQELSSDAVDRAQDAVRAGQELEAMVINCEPARFKITMSVRALAEKETRDAYQQYLKKQQAEGSTKTTLGDAIARQRKN